jgi:outer membrane protein assembly factor BamB
MVWKKLDNIGIGADPCVHNGRLYISPDDGKFYALDAQSGETLWSNEILPNGAKAAAGGGTVYVGGGGSGYFYAFDEATGAEKWKFPTPGGITTTDALLVE